MPCRAAKPSHSQRTRARTLLGQPLHSHEAPQASHQRHIVPRAQVEAPFHTHSNLGVFLLACPLALLYNKTNKLPTQRTEARTLLEYEYLLAHAARSHEALEGRHQRHIEGALHDHAGTRRHEKLHDGIELRPHASRAQELEHTMQTQAPKKLVV